MKIAIRHKKFDFDVLNPLQSRLMSDIFSLGDNGSLISNDTKKHTRRSRVGETYSIIFLGMRCILLGFVLCTCVYSLEADDTSIVRCRVLESMIWPMKDAIPSTVVQALTYARTLNGSCFWPDINYADQSIVLWNTALHMSRINVMLQAFTVDGSSVQNDTRLGIAIHCALNIWLVHDWRNPNWWFNEINIPLLATGELLMLVAHATAIEIDKIKEISFRAAWWLHRSTDIGANLVNMLQVQLYRSLATDNQTGIEEGFARMWQDMAVVSVEEEGIQNDGAYHFHGQQLLSGSHGVVWARSIFPFLICSNGTRYQTNHEQLLVLGEFEQGSHRLLKSNRNTHFFSLSIGARLFIHLHPSTISFQVEGNTCHLVDRVSPCQE